jgi:hypothetical protein
MHQVSDLDGVPATAAERHALHGMALFCLGFQWSDLIRKLAGAARF